MVYKGEKMKVETSPVLDFSKARTPGISAMMRIKNGEDYLEASIRSVVDQVDEIICVFNDSTDQTENILLSLEEEFEHLKVFKYIPKVYPPNSIGYLKTPENSPHSLAYYYNFALSKTTKEYVFKLDDDQLYFKGIIQTLKKKLNNPQTSIGLRGINLIDLKQKLYIDKSAKVTAGADILLFKYNSSCKFIKIDLYEQFSSNHKRIGIENVFYHTKRCKKDRGINNYDLVDKNKQSRYYNMTKSFFNNMNLIPFDDWNKTQNLPDPFELGFSFVNEGKKVYNVSEFQNFENNIKL